MGYSTPNGKELQIVKIDNSSLYGVNFKSGGELPKSLTGKWTSMLLAEKAIFGYIEEKTEQLVEEEAVKLRAEARAVAKAGVEAQAKVAASKKVTVKSGKPSSK